MREQERRITLAEARGMQVAEDAALSKSEKETLFGISRVRPGWIAVDSRQARHIRWALSRPEFDPEEIMARGDRVISIRGWLPEGYLSLRLVPRRFGQYLGRGRAREAPAQGGENA